MANVEYLDTTNVNGVRESTNGYYTGDKTLHGTIMQDAASGAVNTPYSVEMGTIRHGTIMGDAASDANMPEVDAAHPPLGGGGE